jgi:hypothetical protein
VKLKPEELAPFATAVVERLVPILQSMTSMPRSIVENRCCPAPHALIHPGTPPHRRAAPQARMHTCTP